MITPIKFYELTLRNFSSFGNNLTKVNLNRNTLTLIMGKNLDASVNGQIDSNGSGKTTIIAAICYCLYDRIIEESKTPKDDLINNVNKKNMEVSISFEKDGFFYRIVRFRKNKERGGTGISIYKGTTLEEVDYDNIKKDDDIAEAGTADDQIIKLIQIPFDIFTRNIVFSGSHEPFLLLPSTSSTGKANQKDIIEELVGLVELSNKADKLKKEISSDNKELDILIKIQEEINNQKTKISTQIDIIKSKINSWEIEKANKISSIEKNIDNYKKIDFEKQKELLHSYNNLVSSKSDISEQLKLLTVKLNTSSQAVKKYDDWNVLHNKKLDELSIRFKSLPELDYDNQLELLNLKDELSNELDKLTVKSTDIQKELQKTVKQTSETATQIEHLQDNKCPYCLQQYDDAASKIKDLEDIITKNYTLEKNMIKALADIVEKSNKLTTSIKEIKDLLLYESIQDLHKQKMKVDSVTSEYMNEKELVNPYDDNIDEHRTNVSSLISKIDLLEDEISKINNELSTIKSNIVFDDEIQLNKSMMQIDQLKIDLDKEILSINPHISALESLQEMTDEESKKEEIKIIKNRIEHKQYLHKLLTKPDSFIRKTLLIDKLKYLNTQLKHYLDILGLPHKVRFTEELEVKISQFGIDINHTRLSTGQKARINIALSFAFRDVLQARYGKINFCMLDEFLDYGLSNAGITQAVKMIKTIANNDKLSMFVISHKDEISTSFDNIIEVELLNGFSTIKE